MKVFVRVIVSLLFGGIFYFVLLGIYIGIFIRFPRVLSLIEAVIFWLAAPVITALGFTTGIVLYEHLTRKRRAKFFHIFVWPLIGCAIGAGAVYWYGSMLIVFGMFVAGTASIVIREVVLNIKKGKNSQVEVN